MNRIKLLRQELGWRQADLSQKLKTSRQAVGNYEAGERGLDVDTICKLCDIFGVSADYLLGRSEDRGGASEITSEDAVLLHAYRLAPPSVQGAITLLLAPYAGAEKGREESVS